MDTEQSGDSPPKPKSRKNNGTRPPGAITAAQREDRVRYAIETFSNCRTKEEQLARIMDYANVERKQALRIYEEAKQHMSEAYRDYERKAAEDAYHFLQSIRLSPAIKAADRLAAQKQLTELFGPIREQRVAVSGVTTVVNVGVQSALLQNERALEAALALESALASHEPALLTEAKEEAKDGAI